ncbi:hypothetical protein FSP39_016571 [Pinctada imbricata]|uniref:Kynurenine formamidase n=1 Tax=Pinctada imbricata TaxID=66713 RepID=A0AA89C1M3_PINIB|nr:hypothetical protein FSP39_016571 [Pinctada imbricata]
MLLYLTVFLCCFPNVQSETRIVDLSHIYDDEAVGWPIFPKVNITVEQQGYVPLYKSWIEYNSICAPEHRGTHVDAPSHFAEGVWRAHQIPMERMFGRGVVVNVEAKANKDPNYAITIDDVKEWEQKHGKIPYGAVFIMNSGWYKRYPDKHRVYNTTDLANISSFNFPGIPGETTKWLIDKRKIHVLGVDTPSIDDGNSARANSFRSHIYFSNRNIIGIENLANLDAVPESGSMIYVPVPKTRDGSGGLSRVFATYDDAMNGCKRTGEAMLQVIAMCALLFNLIYLF